MYIKNNLLAYGKRSITLEALTDLLKADPADTKALFDKANCKKSYLEFRNGNHAEDLYNDFRDEFLKACKTWLTEN